MVCACRYSVEDQHTKVVFVGDVLWKCKIVKCGDDTVINARLRVGWNWLGISVSGWILYYSYRTFRFRRCRVLYGAGSLMTGFCSVVLLEEVLSPELIPWRSVAIISPICFFFSWSDIRKGKSVPLQAWSGPEGSRKLRFPHFVTTAQDGGKVVSLMHRPPLPPGNAPGTHYR